MNKTPAESAALAAELRAMLAAPPHAAVAICPPYTSLAAAAAAVAGTSIALGGQNLHAEPAGAFTGKVATPAQAAEAHRLIRGTLDRVVGSGAGAEIAILYGGSVNPANAPALFAEQETDGALVGGASLEAASFWRIVVAAG